LGGDPPAIEELEAGDPAPDIAWEAAFEEVLLGTMLDLVRREVATETFQAFELLALHRLSGADASRATGLSRNAVYLARKRVLERLRELGAGYCANGRLDDRLRSAMRTLPHGDIQRSVSDQVELTMTLEGLSDDRAR
jgi:hypothetical protein